MDQRLKLHKVLCDILKSKNVYYQPPESTKLKYPCIIYSLDSISSEYANNNKYTKNKKYKITYIDSNPDNTTYEDILDLELCSLNRIFVNDNLYHYSFNLYF